MKVGDLVKVQMWHFTGSIGILIDSPMSGLWMVLVDNVVYELLERSLEVVSESR